MNIRRRVRHAAGTVLLIALGLAGVAGVMVVLMKHEGGESSRSVAARSAVDPRFSPAREGLCTAVERARAGDGPGARGLFFQRSHQPLHELAAAVKNQDRAAVARFLEAKAQLEASLDPPHTYLAANLGTLAQAVGQAMWTLGGNDPGPCPPQP